MCFLIFLSTFKSNRQPYKNQKGIQVKWNELYCQGDSRSGSREWNDISLEGRNTWSFGSGGSINTPRRNIGTGIQLACVSLWTATKTLATATALFHVKEFILYQTLIKSTTKNTHTGTLAGPHRAYGGNGILSTVQLALTCRVVNRLQAIILPIQDDVYAKAATET